MVFCMFTRGCHGANGDLFRFFLGRRRCTWWWMLGLEALVTAMRAPPPWWLKQLTAYCKMRTQAAAAHGNTFPVISHLVASQWIEATWGKPLLQVSLQPLPVAAIILFQLSCSKPWAPTPGAKLRSGWGTPVFHLAHLNFFERLDPELKVLEIGVANRLNIPPLYRQLLWSILLKADLRVGFMSYMCAYIYIYMYI